MRIIKFRGLIMFSGHGNGFVYGLMFIQQQKTMIRWMHNPLTNDYTDIEVKPESVGQYTGLQDENGVDLYENDYVTYYNPHSKETYNHIIKWSDDFACFALYEKGNEFVKEFDWVKIENIKLIGNIHQS